MNNRTQHHGERHSLLVDQTKDDLQWSVPSFTPVDDQPEFLLRFRDSNSKEFLHTNLRVSVLWPYKPRATDEFVLGRGEMLQILCIYADEWVFGYGWMIRQRSGLAEPHKGHTSCVAGL